MGAIVWHCKSCDQQLSHRHLSKIDCLKSRTACLVCFIGTVNGHCKKIKNKPWKTGASSRHITNLKQSILNFRYLCTASSFSLRAYFSTLGCWNFLGNSLSLFQLKCSRKFPHVLWCNVLQHCTINIDKNCGQGSIHGQTLANWTKPLPSFQL